MKVKYPNYRQALSLMNDYQFLIGKPFETELLDNAVKQILVAPYSSILQWQFLRDVNRGIYPTSALHICKDGRFDVLVLSELKKNDKGGFLWKDLRSYLREHNHPFDMSKYN